MPQHSLDTNSQYLYYLASFCTTHHLSYVPYEHFIDQYETLLFVHICLFYIDMINFQGQFIYSIQAGIQSFIHQYFIKDVIGFVLSTKLIFAEFADDISSILLFNFVFHSQVIESFRPQQSSPFIMRGGLARWGVPGEQQIHIVLWSHCVTMHI